METKNIICCYSQGLFLVKYSRAGIHHFGCMGYCPEGQHLCTERGTDKCEEYEALEKLIMRKNQLEDEESKKRLQKIS
jgi:hypothetical protein